MVNAKSVYRQIKKRYPEIKTILYFASIGAILAGSFVFPQLPRLLKGRNWRYEDFLPETTWEEFDQRRLRQRLKELHKRKDIRIYRVQDRFVVKITSKGKKKFLKYKLEELTIPKPDKWDARWRIVAYDVPQEKKAAREALRTTLKRLNFLELQKSVYLYPYPCSDAIEFLREIYGIGENVTLLTVGYLENEEVYKEYFEL